MVTQCVYDESRDIKPVSARGEGEATRREAVVGSIPPQTEAFQHGTQLVPWATESYYEQPMIRCCASWDQLLIPDQQISGSEIRRVIRTADA
jgi:hypothetical protein